MEFKEQQIKGVFEITFEPKWDDRGYFMRTYDAKEFEKNGVTMEWVQFNHSYSQKKGIIRGLHFQFPPFAETKLVRCMRGAILDVYVDLRSGSGTFGTWGSIELSENNFKAILIPRGFAHGFCTLTDISEVKYKVDNYYTPSHEGSLLYNDPDINIKWPVTEPIVSKKDHMALSFREFKQKYNSISLV